MVRGLNFAAVLKSQGEPIAMVWFPGPAGGFGALPKRKRVGVSHHASVVPAGSSLLVVLA